MPKALVISTEPEYDPAMRVLAGYARTLAQEVGIDAAACLHDLPAAAIRAKLQALNGEAVFCFLHGRDTSPWIVDGDEAAVVDAGSMDLLARRVVCGTCYSLNGFADEAVGSHGATVIGYDGAMRVIVDPDHAADVSDAVLTAPRSLLAGATAGAAMEAARDAYWALADHWYGTPGGAGPVLASFVAWNAEAIGIKGDAAVTI